MKWVKGEGMKKCLKIMLWVQKLPKDFLKDIVQKKVSALGLEGIAQKIDKQEIKIIICGESSRLEAFLEFFYKTLEKILVDDIQVEPFIKKTEYRSIFRIIE